jgi:hypothetical protein
MERVVWIQRLQGLIFVLSSLPSSTSMISSLEVLCSVMICPLVPPLEIRLESVL